MNEILKRHQRYIRFLIIKWIGNQDDDLEQQVLIKTWKNQKSYTEQGKFKQYIGTITANVCRDYFKSKHHRQNVLSDALPDETNLAVLPMQAEITDAKKRKKIIWRAVRSLPYSLRRVIELKEFEDLTLDEIAARLNIPVGTVKSRLNTARKILADKLYYLKGE